MKCVICKRGSVHDGTSTLTLEKKGATLVFKSVPSKVCENCGETYVDSKTTGRLLKTASQIVKAGVRVDIRDYVAA